MKPMQKPTKLQQYGGLCIQLCNIKILIKKQKTDEDEKNSKIFSFCDDPQLVVAPLQKTQSCKLL
jgi:hypothetical protein